MGFAPSWLLIAALLTTYYAPIIQRAVGTSSGVALATALGYAVIFAFCVLAHELGHTAVALLLGRRVRRIVIFFLGGVSEIEQEPARPRDEFLIAAAGPAVSLVIAGLGALVMLGASSDTLLGVLFLLLTWSNLVVAVFNLLPGLPLDGGRVMRAAVWAVSRSRLTGTRVAAWLGRALAVLLALFGLLADQGRWGFGAGLITLLLAAYLWFGAGQSLKAAEMLDRLPQVNIDTLLRPGLLVPADLSIAEALRRLWDGGARGLVLVDTYDRPSAIVDEARVSAVPVDRRPWVGIRTVARPLEDGLVLRKGLSAEDLLAAIRATPANEYLVVDERGAPAGILSTADLAGALGAR